MKQSVLILVLRVPYKVISTGVLVISVLKG